MESPEDVLVSVEGEDDGAVEDGNNVRIQNLKKTILSLSNNSEKNEEFDLLELLVGLPVL